MHTMPNRGWTALKRLVDVIIVLAALPLLAPLLLLIAIWIKLDSPGPVIYRSRRMGQHGRPFTIYKFRTLFEHSPPVHAPDGSLLVLPDDPRLTRAGRLLRVGLDELPQLINVLRGQMSIVGPRADPPEARATYAAPDHARLDVKPGMTGLAQVNGRTAIPLAQRRAYDVAYAAHGSPLIDSCIALLTMFELLPFLRRPGYRLCQRLTQLTNRLAGIQSPPADWGKPNETDTVTRAKEADQPARTAH